MPQKSPKLCLEMERLPEGLAKSVPGEAADSVGGGSLTKKSRR